MTVIGTSFVVPGDDSNFRTDPDIKERDFENQKPTPKFMANWPWAVGGLVLVGLHLIIVAWSPLFAYGADPGDKTFIALLLIELAACLCYTVFVALLSFFHAGKFSFVVILLVGLLLRVLMTSAQPIKANDFYRYFWDGAVTANGLNPYTYSPKEILQAVEHPDIPNDVPMEFRRLAQRSVTTLSRINHSHLRTIYPPGTQGLFALAYWLSPFQVTGWRAILFLLDIATMALLLILLRSQNISLRYAVIYWWNPLLIYETFSKCHFDLALGFWLLLFIWALSRHKPLLAGSALALAISIKLWPLLLLPFLILTFRHNRPRLLTSTGIFTLIMGLMILLFHTALQNVSDSGVIVYAQTWQSNAGLYHALDWLTQQVSALIEIDVSFAARAAAVTMIFTTAFVLACRTKTDITSLALATGVVIVLMLLLTPVLYSWYYLPLLPLAAITRRWTFLAFTLLLPISYFAWEIETLAYLVWFIHIPVWGILLWEFCLKDIIARQKKIINA